MTENFIYPANPSNVPISVTEPSASFKKEVGGVMGNIVLFFVVYLILFILSIGLAIACFYGGIALIIAMPRLITIIAGIGLMGVGIMIFVFLIKFLFAVSKYDRSGIIEITEQDQPKLFAFIRKLTNDTQTPFPKKIFISPDVNACVFYDSGFWSMFLPVKKNLQIGLGLVNSVNISEFKAVMAHEFGHFSQRSMKLGSFVYNVNRIIYNMMYENTSYSNFLSGWGNVSDILGIFASITASIARGIQSILRGMYGIINKSYMRLSREMEFHADAVAASVSGGNNLVSALRRIEMADSAYNVTLQKCDELYKAKKISGNIYLNQSSVLKRYAKDFKLNMENGIPVVSQEFLNSHKLSRVNYKDQWASHPATDDREEHLNGLGVNADVMHESAWILFDSKEQLQAELTQKIYEHVEKPAEITTIEDIEFANKLEEDTKTYTLPELYKSFYDGRQIAILKEEDIANANKSMSFSDFINAETASLPKKIAAAAGDIEVLKSIVSKNIQTKTFDFDGVKHKQEEAAAVADKMEAEQKEMRQQLETLDKQVVNFFYSKAKASGEGDVLMAMYKKYFEDRTKADEFLNQMNSMMDNLQIIYTGQTIQIEQINNMISTLKTNHEPQFKKWLKEWTDKNAFVLDSATKEKVGKFYFSDYKYFDGTRFFETELNELHQLCNESWVAVNNFLFLQFKTILEYQVKFV
jgi:Zn-dependent protease with chaperone function